MELPSKDDKNNAEKQKNTSEKPRSGFWSRLKNYTAEPPKTVVIENGVEKLVLITPEITVTPKTILPKEETIKGKPAEKPTIVPRRDVVDVVVEKPIEKPAPIPKEAVVKEKPPEKPSLTPQKAVIKQIPVEKPVSVSPAPVFREAPVDKPVSVLPKTTVEKEKAERKPLSSSEKLKKGLEKTRGRFWSRLRNFISFRRKIDESVLEELEDILIGADIGAKPVKKIIHELHEAWKTQAITETSQIHDFIKNKLKEVR